MNIPIEWLLSGEPWIEYRSRLDLLGQTSADPLVVAARQRMLADEQVHGLIQELTAWPGTAVSSHKNAGQLFHKLTFVADLGVLASDPGMQTVVDRIMAHQDEEGPFQLPMNIPTHFGGTGRDEMAWALCDAPLTIYALASMGLSTSALVNKAVAHLTALARENGWPCAGSKELGKFRGPGRKDDPCPFANLAMLKVLSARGEWMESHACRVGAEALLTLWSERRSQHPYIFYMGTDFCKLKVPFVWYDLMHVLDVLSRFTWLHKDQRLVEMLAILKSKMDSQGRFSIESVWTAWKSWEFGQKKLPSRWLSLCAWRIIRRVESPLA